MSCRFDQSFYRGISIELDRLLYISIGVPIGELLSKFKTSPLWYPALSSWD